MPARSTVVRRPFGARTRRGLLQQRGGLLDPRKAFHAHEQLFVKAVAAAGAQLQGRRTRDGADDFGGWSRAMLDSSDRGREHERHGDRDADRPQSSSCTACTRSRRR